MCIETTAHVVKTPTVPGLSVRLRSNWLAGVLRVDSIRDDTLVQLVKHWGDPQARDEIIEALDSLAEAVQGNAHGDLIQARVEIIEDVAAMEYAEEELSRDCLNRLLRELGDVADTLNRFEKIEHP